jgi:hypothetical protein
MADKTMGDLGLWIPRMNDSIDGPDGTIEKHLPENFQKIDEEFTTHMAETASKHITESGSNTNGNYIKYDDGTMICYRTLVAGSRIAFGAGTLADPYRTVGFTWTFPASFNGIPVLCLTARIESSNAAVRANSCAFHSIDNVGATQIQSIMVSSNSTAADVFINCIAIGRWKV